MKGLLAGFLALVLSNTASATSLTATFGGDDIVEAYVSESVWGTGEILGKSDFFVNGFVTATMHNLKGPLSFVQFAIYNSGGPASVIAELTLSDANFKFANGTQKLRTNTDNILFTDALLSDQFFTPELIGSAALFGYGAFDLTDPDNTNFVGVYNANPVTYYFAAIPIYANNVSAVPELETSAMMAFGIGLLGYIGRRRKHHSA
ncbi:hypothetical protein [Methylovorus mays]|uniref:hypothetical protein n=1 Tax=Methylovorus mays TaxID=184077 RepID=UPI001E58D46D|nr:hypothetical protein [Methylovorus mays]MCB5206492.1 hypothetical protein [Methylovorus mays]